MNWYDSMVLPYSFFFFWSWTWSTLLNNFIFTVRVFWKFRRQWEFKRHLVMISAWLGRLLERKWWSLWSLKATKSNMTNLFYSKLPFESLGDLMYCEGNNFWVACPILHTNLLKLFMITRPHSRKYNFFFSTQLRNVAFVALLKKKVVNIYNSVINDF